MATRPYSHPDERLHVEAFRYFAAHAWPPDLNSSQLLYDPYGTSKVYAREIVYTILGPFGRLVETVVGTPHPTIAFRLLNVALLPLALGALLRLRSAILPSGAVAVVFASVPQVLYVFAYANSDAWAVALSVLLFAQALRLAGSQPRWPLHQTAILGALTGLLLASKDNFLLALALPAILLVPRISAGAGRRGLLLFVLLAALPPLPFKIVYPLTQPDFAGATWRMAEERAEPSFKPSDPTRAGTSTGGGSALEMLQDGEFLVRSAQSAWGVYGHMDVFHAKGVYAGVAALVLLNLGLTAFAARRGWSDLPPALRQLLVAAPFVILLNLALSLRWSAEIYYQPQGRYLFPSLVPGALLLAGTVGREGVRTRRLRIASAGLALALAAWSLLFLALPRLSAG